MSKFTFASLALAAALAITPSASATSITGSIALAGLVGGYTTSTITFDHNGIVLGGTGSLGLTSGLAAMDGGTYPNVLNLNSAIGDVLFATSGADAVTFTIQSLVFDTKLGDLDVNGTGLFTETGYAPTEGTFDLSTSRSGASITFDADASANVTPEPSSLLLLGTGLLGLAIIAFRKAKSSSGGLMALGM
jgi:PEP-CTERM motif